MGFNTITGGSFIDASGNPLANGYLTMELCSDSQQTSPPAQIVGGIVIKVLLDNTGNVAGEPEIAANDTLNPANSCYLVDAFAADGTRAWKAPQYQKVLSTPNPYNINVWVPGSNSGCGCGSGQGGGLCPNGIVLQTGGVNNGNQCLQNLVAGENVTISDDGEGDITFSSGAGTQNLLVATTALTASQVNNLKGSPITIVPAQAGKVIVPVTITLQLVPGSALFGTFDGDFIMDVDFADAVYGLSLSGALWVDAPTGRMAVLNCNITTDNAEVWDLSLYENQPLQISQNGDQEWELWGGIATSSVASGGASYVATEPFTVVNSPPILGTYPIATGIIDTVDGGGAVLTYHLTYAGTDYAVTPSQDTAVTGSGDGTFTIDITAITPGNGSVVVTVAYLLVGV